MRYDLDFSCLALGSKSSLHFDTRASGAVLAGGRCHRLLVVPHPRAGMRAGDVDSDRTTAILLGRGQQVTRHCSACGG